MRGEGHRAIPDGPHDALVDECDHGGGDQDAGGAHDDDVGASHVHSDIAKH